MSFKYKFISSLFSLVCAGLLHGAIPKDYSLKTIKSTAEILLEYPETHPFGRVKIEQKGSYTYFYYTDNAGKLIAFGRTEKDAEQVLIEVYDASSSLLGVIERGGRSLAQSSYSVYDASNQPVINGSMNLLGTRLHFTTNDHEKKEVILLYRPYFQLLGDYWYTKVREKGAIDERLIVIVSATHASILLGTSILG